MLLIGMLDSPYVRRVAISLRLLGLSFEHRSVSVFRAFAEFQAINPVVKAPTLVCHDGTVLMDSSLILQYAESLAAPRSLLPSDVPSLQADLRVIGLGMAACDKSVQLHYERTLRPPEKQHEPWVTRVTGQLLAAHAPKAIVMHPGPIIRGMEITAGVADGVQSTILEQVTNGVAIRMAVVERALLASGAPSDRSSSLGRNEGGRA